MEFNFKNVLIYGYSKSGKACEEVLKSLNVNYKVLDDNLKIDGGKYINKINKKNIKDFDLIVVSPAIRIDNKVFKLAEKNNVKIIGELEFGYYFCSCPIIAVTGTNGKTTTVNLITKILQTAGYNAKFFGNVGVPFSEVFYENNLDYAIVEVSSFQLETTNKFKPTIGVILNIFSDHLDRHITNENYINLKISLLKNCGKDVQCVLNGGDNNITQHIHQIVANKNYFVTNYELAKEIKKFKQTNIFSIHNNLIVNLKDLNNSELIDVSKISSVFYEDILASVAVCDLLNIDYDSIKKAIFNFQWLKHRVEFVGEINNIKFYDDSKATNIHAVINAVKSFNNNVILLLGGQDKNLDFSTLFKNLSLNVCKIVLFGESRHKILKVAKSFKFKNVESCENLVDAVNVAYKSASGGDVVLLSPACASFDCYSGYAERGNHFKDIFNEIKNGKVNYDKEE